MVLDLIKTIKIRALFENRTYDTDSMINYTEQLCIKTVMLPKFNCKANRNFDFNLYRLRYIDAHHLKISVVFCVSFFVHFVLMSLVFL